MIDSVNLLRRESKSELAEFRCENLGHGDHRRGVRTTAAGVEYFVPVSGLVRLADYRHTRCDSAGSFAANARSAFRNAGASSGSMAQIVNV